MRSDLIELAASLLRPLSPEPTAVAPDLRPLPGIRAVLFDVYGTLLVSEAGEPVECGRPHGDLAVCAAFEACGLSSCPTDKAAAVDLVLRRVVSAEKDRLRAAGSPHPEIDILAVWSRVLDLCRTEGLVSTDIPEPDLERLALVHECMANPVWPMPGAADTLAGLRARGFVLGIVSNAQFYTPLILQALFGADLKALGFDDGCCAWSYRAGIGKPDPALFRLAARGLLKRHGIAPGETLFVGNHIEKDVVAAAAASFVTCLFAGDARSLKMHAPPGIAVQPDAVVVRLDQIPGLLDDAVKGMGT
ncbi:MAG: HAD family hydrolase [Verrucomicrobia bacterium]|nr:HAD family hydrolase [Verrucomicrobiota bacterium]